MVSLTPEKKKESFTPAMGPEFTFPFTREGRVRGFYRKDSLSKTPPPAV
jgi:hypothetical protein